MEEGINIVNEVGDLAVTIYSVKRDGDKLVMDGKALGTMRMDMIVTAEEALKGLRIVFTWPFLSFMFLMPYFWVTKWVHRALERDKSK